MSASVRMEDEAFSDERYEDLAAAAGLADADHARGKMARLWRQCTLENTYVLSAQTVTRILGDRGIDALVLSRLGELTDGGIRIRGTRGRIEWLKKLRSNGKFGRRGGRPRKTHEGFANKTLEGVENKTPPAPAPAPAPALKELSAPADLVLEPPKPKRRGKTSPEDEAVRQTYARCVDAFFVRYEAKNNAKPTWGAEHGANLNRLLKQHGEVEYMRRLENAFVAPPPWITELDFFSFVRHFDKFTKPYEAPARGSKSERPRMEDL